MSNSVWIPQLLQYKSHLKIVGSNAEKKLFCSIRKQWLTLQPEEVVRQLCIQYLVKEQSIRISSITVEKQLALQNKDRVDIAIFVEGVTPYMLVECKSWDVKLNQLVFNQTARYQNAVPFKYVWVTNGIENKMFTIDDKGEYRELDSFPTDYS